METMSAPKNPPLCKFGPGGDFVSQWPDKQQPMTTEQRADVEKRAWSRIMADLGLEAPLVSADPAGITFQHKAGKLKHTVGSLLEVLRRVRGDAPGQQSDQHLVASQIAAADAALARMPQNATPAEQALKVREAILAAASAKLDEVAMTSENEPRVAADTAFAVAKTRKAKENTNDATDRHTQTTGYSEVHPGLPDREWLFPDHAGDRRPSQPDKGHGVRTRRSTRKKATPATRRQAQSPLFAGLA
jgi:hypothetical protein